MAQSALGCDCRRSDENDSSVVDAKVSDVRELEEYDSGIWTFHQPLSVLGAQIGCRMTVVRLQDGGLMIHSPIRLTPELRRRLDSVGRVAAVLAPNADHYFFIGDYRDAYPTAKYFAALGVAEKLPAFRFDEVLEHPQTVSSWGDTVDQAYFRASPQLHELVLFHRATSTLISADLSFNVQASGGLLSGLMLRLNDSYKTFGPSRVCRRHITTPDTARRDLDAILAWSPERMVVSHGEVLMRGAEQELRRAYGWLG
jgi:hypothetical protein